MLKEKEVILIIDDDPEDIENFKFRIKDVHAEYIVESETDFSKTIEKINDLKTCGKKVIAVFIDICESKDGDFKYPGYDTIYAVKQKFENIFIVAYTQYTNDEIIKKVYDNGAHWYYEKQKLRELTLETLKKEIEKHTDKDISGINLIEKILANFSNSIIKITKNRRKAHDLFKVVDEYDVQDIIYTMLKPIFNDITDEDPVRKVGGKSSKIDFFIPSENIGLEIKMIKENESDESKYIDELKKDFESYSIEDMEYLICFVYDPYKKTNDANNFYSLNGKRNIKNTHFNVKCIVQH
ncbi:MAG: response regulator [Planctomycetes bacterium]|nr:response regulator [Planctomycetota bacterium]